MEQYIYNNDDESEMIKFSKMVLVIRIVSLSNIMYTIPKKTYIPIKIQKKVTQQQNLFILQHKVKKNICSGTGFRKLRLDVEIEKAPRVYLPPFYTQYMPKIIWE